MYVHPCRRTRTRIHANAHSRRVGAAVLPRESKDTVRIMNCNSASGSRVVWAPYRLTDTLKSWRSGVQTRHSSRQGTIRIRDPRDSRLGTRDLGSKVIRSSRSLSCAGGGGYVRTATCVVTIITNGMLQLWCQSTWTWALLSTVGINYAIYS